MHPGLLLVRSTPFRATQHKDGRDGRQDRHKPDDESHGARDADGGAAGPPARRLQAGAAADGRPGHDAGRGSPPQVLCGGEVRQRLYTRLCCGAVTNGCQ